MPDQHILSFRRPAQQYHDLVKRDKEVPSWPSMYLGCTLDRLVATCGASVRVSLLDIQMSRLQYVHSPSRGEGGLAPLHPLPPQSPLPPAGWGCEHTAVT